jgi:hypothetical protein
MQQRLRESYLEMAFNDSASCVPVGMAWKASIAIDSTINLYSSDNSHPSIYGSYLAACTFYASIFKKSPVGSSFWPTAIDSSTAYSLQQIASSTVLDSLAIWNIFNADFSFMQINDSIICTNLSSNYESVLWDFGDGITSFNEDPIHTYITSGTYEITLSAFSNNGCLVDTHSVTISVNINTAIDELKSPAQLIQITDLLGRKVFIRKSIPLLFHYDDGTIKKRIVIE